jgi:hypothetical protein
MTQKTPPDELRRQAADLVRRINAQDGRATSLPSYYVVRTEETEFHEGTDPAGPGDGTVSGAAYRDEDGEWETEEDLLLRYRCDGKGYASFEEYAANLGYEEAGYWVREHRDCALCGFFLTERAAEEWMKKNAHHLRNPCVCLNHAWRNPEMALILRVLEEFGGVDLERRICE